MKALTKDQKFEIACLVEANKKLDAIRLLRSYLEYVLPIDQAEPLVMKIFTNEIKS
jgi:hypothetical protein